MSIRHLDALFSPASVAVFGASERPGSVGATVWRNLRAGGFQGDIWGVNPRHSRVDGVPVYRDAASLPGVPELAVICTPASQVTGLVAELGRLGTHAAVVVSAGLDGAARQAMLDAARPHTLRILGPNCIGMLVPHHGLNASFAHVAAAPGELAFVSQSGALVTAMLDWAAARGIGFSHFVSLGERADVDFGDLLDYLGSDARTRAILLYIESIDNPRKFMSAARAAARNKPVIVVKSGRSAQGRRAAASHTGKLTGADEVFDAAIARAGMLRVDTLQDLFLAAETLARFRDNRSDTLTILTNGGGAGVMAADAAATAGVPLAVPDSDTLARLDAVLPAHWSRANPVDIIGDAPADRYVAALQALLQAGDDAVLFIHAPTAIVPSADIARALLPQVVPAPGAPRRVMGCWLGQDAVAEARALFRGAGVPDFNTPEEAVRAFGFLRDYRHHQDELMQAPPAAPLAAPSDRAALRALVESVLAEGRELLSEPEAKTLLALAGLPVVPTHRVGAEPAAAARLAATLGFPVVLKILSHDISHKSDVGGVRLDLGSATEVQEAARAMLERVACALPQARVLGFTVQPMVRRRQAQELIVGASVDPLFGPVILFGQGGTAVEVVADRALALPPLNVPLARALIRRTRVARLLQGWRDVPAVDTDALEQALVAVSQLLADVPEIAELDINPLLADAQGVMALDARVRLSPDRPGGAARFAIRPYPQAEVETQAFGERTLTLRPIRPEDEAQHLAFLESLEAEDVRLRVFYSRRSIARSELARLTQIDYAREMAFIAEAATADGRLQTLGTVRAAADPDNDCAEFGVIVRSDLKGAGLGWRLMDKLIRYLRARGTRRLVGTVLKENERMRRLARALGFQETQPPQEPDVVHIELALQEPPPPSGVADR